MRIIHLSDPHFGTQETRVVDALKKSITALKPDYVLVSGDFTQKASRTEFKQAHRFLESLPCPYITVPGNHDVPPLNLWERFTTPYKKYKEYINPDLCPLIENDHAVILGLNSARPIVPHWNWANGAVSKAQCNLMKEVFHPVEKRWNILTLHHPIHKMAGQYPIAVKIFGANRALATIKKLKVDVVLTGHVHHASITPIENEGGHKTLFISASTALSSRIRDHDNGFNVLDFEKNTLTTNTYNLVKNDFVITSTHTHNK